MDRPISGRDTAFEDVGTLARIVRESFRDIAARFSLTAQNCPEHPSNCTTVWIESGRKRGVRYFILSVEFIIDGRGQFNA